ncbi:PorT family protein [Puteibacter caeruleilacunae]|nr:PorT family protein [Puteibacter caeruleilacunae]
MKKSVFIFVVLLLSSIIYSKAQTGMQFGLKAGYNIATQYGSKSSDPAYDVESEARHGFQGGFFLRFPITDAFSVQQEFLYTQKGSGQNVVMTQPAVSTFSDYRIDYFELPIMFRYHFLNIGNVEVYGSSGFALSMLLKGEYDVKGSVDVGGGVKVPIEESGDTDEMDDFDYNFIYGLGLEFDLFDQKCFFDYRQTIGWNMLDMPTSEGAEPAPLRNQTYSLSLGIYF